MGADAADAPGQGQAVHDEAQGFVIFPGLDELDIALGAQVGGTGPDAGGPVELLDGEGGGDRLGIEAIGRLPLGQILVKGVRHGHRADVGALPAAGALGLIDIAGLLLEGDPEVPRLSRNLRHIGEGMDLDVQMPAAFHQLGGNNAHGTVVGGEGLVQLGHDPADGRLGFHQMDIKAGVGQVQGRLHPGDAAAHHHHGAYVAATLG